MTAMSDERLDILVRGERTGKVPWSTERAFTSF
jgi:hypothetical protein